MTLLIWTIVILLFLFGLAGTIIPGFPGISLIFGGVLLYTILNDFEAVSVLTVVLLGILTALTLLLDYLAGILGAKAGGGSWKAALAAGIGALIGGFIFAIPGILIGAFLGGLSGALLEGATREGAMKVALYSALGVLGSAVFQFVIGVTLIVVFFIALFF
ncbi:MAG: DUF456 domain-containing protein [Candidatus Paceibacterota bacterium]